jgi:hypothetical protein
MWREFVELAEKKEDPFAALCARFGISRKTGYKWLNRYRAKGVAGLQHQSRRPKTSPRRMPDAVVDAVLTARRTHPDWSAARLREELAAQKISPLPAPSTIDLILRRQRDLVAAGKAVDPAAMHPGPNFRWIFRLGSDVTLADGVSATAGILQDETTGFILGTVLLTIRREEALRVFIRAMFQRHGLPWRMRVPREEDLRTQPACRAHSPLTVWLVQLGVTVEFSFDPATHVIDSEEIARQQLAVRLARLPAYQRVSLAERAPATDPLEQLAEAAGRHDAGTAVALLEQLRERHNFGGKTEAMQRRSPLSLFRPSPRTLPTELPVPTYAPDADLRLVSEKGIFTFQRRLVHVGRPFAGQYVELRLTSRPDHYTVVFSRHELGVVDLSAAPIDGTTSLPLRCQ